MKFEKLLLLALIVVSTGVRPTVVIADAVAPLQEVSDTQDLDEEMTAKADVRQIILNHLEAPDINNRSDVYQNAFNREYVAKSTIFTRGLQRAQMDWDGQTVIIVTDAMTDEFERAGYLYQLDLLEKHVVASQPIPDHTEACSQPIEQPSAVQPAINEIQPDENLPAVFNRDADSTVAPPEVEQPLPVGEINLDHLSFLNQFIEEARAIASENQLFASVMIAQAALESSWGTSTLSQKPYYNLFGVKGGYQGKSVQMGTDEDDGSGAHYGIKADFRRYSSYHESLQDYAEVLNQPMFDDAHKDRCEDYHQATKCLTGKYATDTSYNLKLDQIIATYHLEQYDHAGKRQTAQKPSKKHAAVKPDQAALQQHVKKKHRPASKLKTVLIGVAIGTVILIVQGRKIIFRQKK